jgi:hypothetical protein
MADPSAVVPSISFKARRPYWLEAEFLLNKLILVEIFMWPENQMLSNADGPASLLFDHIPSHIMETRSLDRHQHTYSKPMLPKAFRIKVSINVKRSVKLSLTASTYLSLSPDC